MNDSCGIVLLAAGSSTRLGTPKQMLAYKQTTLLQYSLSVALESGAGRIVTVLGSQASMLKSVIGEQGFDVVVNESWQEGMASSISCGLSYLLQQVPGLQTVLFMTCDQPFINAALIKDLINLQQQKGYLIVASQYADTTGIPAVFHKDLFANLLTLKGDKGAKQFIAAYADKGTIAFPQGNIDIDTVDDYQLLKKM